MKTKKKLKQLDERLTKIEELLVYRINAKDSEGHDWMISFSEPVKTGETIEAEYKQQEKEFTKDDMIEFGNFFKDRVKSSTYHLAWEDEFNAWLKQRK